MSPRRWPGALLGAAAVMAAGLAWPWPAIDHAPPGSIRGASASTIRLRPPAPDLTTGLVAYYRLQDGSGTTAADASGVAGAGALSGTYTWGTDYLSLATNGVVAIPTGASMAGATRATLCAWLYLTAWPSATSPALVEATSASVGRIILYVSADNRFVLGVRDTAADPAGSLIVLAQSGQQPMTLSAWHLVCGSYDSLADAHAVYIDGSPAASSTTAVAALGASTAAFRRVGNSPSGLAARYAGVRWYRDRALSAAEIAALYAAGRP